MLLYITAGSLYAQKLPVEIFAGHKKATTDLTFFRYIKKHDDKNSPWLFFNRYRASVDYPTKGEDTFKPQFALTFAMSYNPTGWNGLAPVAAFTLTNGGLQPKAGMQYYITRPKLVFFIWALCETMEDPNGEVFILTRYTPRIGDKIKLYFQGESGNRIPLHGEGNSSFFQRVRVGLCQGRIQWGAAADFTQNATDGSGNDQNIGAFLRYEF